MPVLMNKGTDPTCASWLFYTDQTTLEAFAAAVVEGRFDSGAVALDETELEATKKASAPVSVYLDVATLVPANVDLATLGAKIEKPRDAGEKPGENDRAGSTGEAAVPGDDSTGAEPGPDDPADGLSAKERREAAEEAARQAWAEEAASELSYEPEPAPAGLRVLMGTTTRANALTYLAAPGLEHAWNGTLPGLQVLASIVNYMGEHGSVPPHTVWFMDKAGVLRMSPAKQVKPMAGNILSCKL